MFFKNGWCLNFSWTLSDFFQNKEKSHTDLWQEYLCCKLKHSPPRQELKETVLPKLILHAFTPHHFVDGGSGNIFLIYIAAPEFHGWKNVHPVDVYGIHGFIESRHKWKIIVGLYYPSELEHLIIQLILRFIKMHLIWGKMLLDVLILIIIK